LQSTMKVKNSSPIFTTSNRPAPVPMSASRTCRHGTAVCDMCHALV
jgi:hypothetical protein